MSAQVREMFARISPRYDVANSVLSLGIHRLWRRRTVQLALAKPGDRVLDCASGTGDLAIAFKKAVGTSGRVVGTDFCEDMLAHAPAKAKAASVDVEFRVADAMQLPYPDRSFDIASIAFGIRNVDDPSRCVKEMTRVLRPGGRLVVLEFGQPAGVFGAAFRVYARSVMPIVGGWLTGDRSAYEYLPRTAASFPSGDAFVTLMNRAAPFVRVETTPLMQGLAWVYVGFTQS